MIDKGGHASLSRLQIYSVEESDRADGGTCGVRCLGGGAGVGQVFALESDAGAEGPDGGLTLERVERYGRDLTFFDPLDWAHAHFSGRAFARLREGDVLVSHPAPTWQQRLEGCGLQVLGPDTSPALPDVRKAHQAFAGYEVVPAVAVSDARPDAVEELDRQWDSLTASARLMTQNGEFCMPMPKTGWVRVKDPVGVNLPSRMMTGAGKTDFLAVSVDGRVLCAVSQEEYDKWIIVHHFTEES
ncbi:hypothetical protein ACH4A8_28360 [Streptomyces vietnamensis]|uniref:hypothetical protein n=1 Tax=Streptomyces vietnamensis TaxID=362257 RepID=UPI0037B046F0